MKTCSLCHFGSVSDPALVDGLCIVCRALHGYEVEQAGIVPAPHLPQSLVANVVRLQRSLALLDTIGESSDFMTSAGRSRLERLASEIASAGRSFRRSIRGGPALGHALRSPTDGPLLRASLRSYPIDPSTDQVAGWLEHQSSLSHLTAGL